MVVWMSVLHLHTRLLYQCSLLLETEKQIMMFHGSVLFQMLTWRFDWYSLLQLSCQYTFFNVWGKNAQSILYWDIIRFPPMLLISSNKLLYEREIPVQKYCQLAGVFDLLELYNLTATYNANGDWVFLFCRLYEDIPLLFMFYCKLDLIVREKDNAFFKWPLSFRSIPFWKIFINCTNSVGIKSSWIRHIIQCLLFIRHIIWYIDFLTGPITLTRLLK